MPIDADSKLVKIEIRFKCPNTECGVGQSMNGAECMRCVLDHMYRDPNMWNESQRRRPEDAGEINIVGDSVPKVEQSLDPIDLEFLESPSYLLVAQKEWDGKVLGKVLELRHGTPTQAPAQILELPTGDENDKVRKD